MKLNEIATLSHEEIASQIKRHEARNTLPFEDLIDKLTGKHDANVKKLGDGNYAIVTAHSGSPGTVQKTVHTVPYDELLRDGYFRYLFSISRNERVAKNPYFPRVYSINLHQSSEGNVVYTIEMERLSPLGNATGAALLAMGKRMFRGFEETVNAKIGRIEAYRHEHGMEDTKDQNKKADRYLELIADEIDNHIDGTGTLKIVDPYLRHAVGVIKEAANSPDKHFVADIHHENIMMRRASFGFQLVITDPLS
jgi:hypothetical protein